MGDYLYLNISVNKGVFVILLKVNGGYKEVRVLGANGNKIETIRGGLRFWNHKDANR